MLQEGSTTTRIFDKMEPNKQPCTLGPIGLRLRHTLKDILAPATLVPSSCASAPKNAHEEVLLR